MPIISAPIASRATSVRRKRYVKVDAQNVVQGCFPQKGFGPQDIRAYQLCAYVVPEAFHVLLFERARGQFAGRKLFQTGAMEECDILPREINRPLSKEAIVRALIREGREETNLPEELIVKMLMRKHSQMLGSFDAPNPLGGSTYRFYCAIIETRPEEIVYFDPHQDRNITNIYFVPLHKAAQAINPRGSVDSLFYLLYDQLQRALIDFKYHSASDQFTIIDKIQFIEMFKDFKRTVLTAIKGRNLVALPQAAHQLMEAFSRKMGLDAYLLEQAALFLINLYRGSPDKFMALQAYLIQKAQPLIAGKEAFLQRLLLEARIARGFQPLLDISEFPGVRLHEVEQPVFRPL